MGNNVTGYHHLMTAILAKACIDSRSKNKNIRHDAMVWLGVNGDYWAWILGWEVNWTKMSCWSNEQIFTLKKLFDK